MEPVTAAVLLKGLDGLSARAVATAQNIANAGTVGYRPVRVSFEAALGEAAARGPDAVRALRPAFAADPGFVVGDALRLDLEMAEASGTAGRYAALAELLNRQAQITALAVTGGR